MTTASTCGQCGAGITPEAWHAGVCAYCGAMLRPPEPLQGRGPRIIHASALREEDRVALHAAIDQMTRAAGGTVPTGALGGDAQVGSGVLAGAQFDAEIDGMKRSAYGWVVVLIAAMLGGIAWCFALPTLGLGSGIAVVPAVVILVLLIVATAMAARPVQRRTGYDGEMMLFVAWFFLIFAVVMPIGVMALGVAIKRFTGKLGGATISRSSGNTVIPGTSRYYPPIRLVRGETYPLAYIYLAMAFLWPALVFAAIAPTQGVDLRSLRLVHAERLERALFHRGREYDLDKRILKLEGQANEMPPVDASQNTPPPPPGKLKSVPAQPPPRVAPNVSSPPPSRPTPQPARETCRCAPDDILCSMRCSKR